LRPILLGIVGTVGFGRIYVGAHLPHDVVGGAGLGMMISAVIPPADGG
jgi:membrane-associated phospholipid phosphatase